MKALAARKGRGSCSPASVVCCNWHAASVAATAATASKLEKNRHQQLGTELFTHALPVLFCELRLTTSERGDMLGELLRANGAGATCAAEKHLPLMGQSTHRRNIMQSTVARSSPQKAWHPRVPRRPQHMQCVNCRQWVGARKHTRGFAAVARGSKLLS